MFKIVAATLVLASSLVGNAVAQTYTCPRPTGWTAFTDRHCADRACPQSTKWGPDEVLHPTFLLKISASDLELSASSGESTPFLRELGIVSRNEHRVTALAATESGTQVFQFFFAKRTLHWLDSNYLPIPPEGRVELLAFTTICDEQR